MTLISSDFLRFAAGCPQKLADFESAAETYATDILMQYESLVGPVIKGAEFAQEEQDAEASDPASMHIGTESVALHGHNIGIFSSERIALLEEDMREAALAAARGVLPHSGLECSVTLHSGDHTSEETVPVTASTAFFVAPADIAAAPEPAL